MKMEQPASSPGRSMTIARSLLIKLMLFAGATGAISWLLIHMPPPLIPAEFGPRSPDPIVVSLSEKPPPPATSLSDQPSPAVPPDTPETARIDAPSRASRSTGAKLTAQVAPAPLEHRLDLNRATQAELELLPGVGPGLAKRILDYKESHGRYRTVDELREVKGIGEKRWRRLEPLLMVVAITPPVPSGSHKKAGHKHGQT